MDLIAVNNFGDTRSGGLAGPMGLFVIVLMSIATVLLIRNMNKRLRRLPDSFPDSRVAARDAEVARLEADLARGGSGAARGPGAQDLSDVDGAGVDAEVAAVDSPEASAKDAGRGDRG